jgi:hypothetical protein
MVGWLVYTVASAFEGGWRSVLTIDDGALLQGLSSQAVTTLLSLVVSTGMSLPGFVGDTRAVKMPYEAYLVHRYLERNHSWGYRTVSEACIST